MASNIGGGLNGYSADDLLRNMEKLAEKQQQLMRGQMLGDTNYYQAQYPPPQEMFEEAYQEYEEIEITDFRKKAIDEKLKHLKKK